MGLLSALRHRTKKRCVSDLNEDVRASVSAGRFISRAALSHALGRIRSTGQLSEDSMGTSSSSVLRAIKRRTTATTRYGDVFRVLKLPQPKGRVHNWACINPFSYLNWLCQHSLQFSNFLQTCYDKRPATPAKPWQIILYADEITSGNVLATMHARKAWGIY